MSRIGFISLCFVVLAACGELSRTPGADAGTGTGRIRCAFCEDELLTCVAGQCVRPCEGLLPFECAESDHCLRGLCVPVRVPSCEEDPCNADQACVSGYCVVIAGASGECRGVGGACGAKEVCLPDRGRCASAPPCDRDGTCRVGTLGAVCNARPAGGQEPDPRAWEDVCLLGRCTSDAHCPSPMTCREIGAEVEGLGVCR